MSKKHLRSTPERQSQLYKSFQPAQTDRKEEEDDIDQQLSVFESKFKKGDENFRKFKEMRAQAGAMHFKQVEDRLENFRHQTKKLEEEALAKSIDKMLQYEERQVRMAGK